MHYGLHVCVCVCVCCYDMSLLPTDVRFVNSFGYVNLFPFLLKLVSPSSEQLGYTLDRLANKSVSR